MNERISITSFDTIATSFTCKLVKSEMPCVHNHNPYEANGRLCETNFRTGESFKVSMVLFKSLYIGHCDTSDNNPGSLNLKINLPIVYRTSRDYQTETSVEVNNFRVLNTSILAYCRGIRAAWKKPRDILTGFLAACKSSHLSYKSSRVPYKSSRVFYKSSRVLYKSSRVLYKSFRNIKTFTLVFRIISVLITYRFFDRYRSFRVRLISSLASDHRSPEYIQNCNFRKNYGFKKF